MKGFDNALYNDFHTFYHYSGGDKNNSTRSWYKIRNGYYQRIMNYGGKYLDPDTIFKIEKKIDDGKPNAGMLRSGCTTSTGAGVPYETLVKNKTNCINVWYFIMGL